MELDDEKLFEKNGIIFYGRMAEVASQMDDAEMDFFKISDIISDQIYDYMEASNITKSELARRMKSSRPFITKILSGDMNLTLKTLTKILHCLGLRAEVKLVEKNQAVSWFSVIRNTVPIRNEMATSSYKVVNTLINRAVGGGKVCNLMVDSKAA